MTTSLKLEGFALADVRRMFAYLDGVRASGSLNMFGAAPWLADAYDMPATNARKVLSAWMETFDGDLSAEDRARRALKASGEPS